MTRDSNQLITFPPSVDSETARLILLYHRVPTTELRQSATGSGLRAAWHRAAIPILRGQGLKLSPSLQIAEHFDAMVAPELRLTGQPGEEADEIAELWEELHHEMGVWIAEWSYFFILQHKKLALRLMGSGVPGWQGALDRVAFPIVRWAMRRKLQRLNRDVALMARAECRRVFVNVGAALSRGSDYLVGNRITLADISFAACAAPIMLSEDYHGVIPGFDEASEEMREFARELRSQAAGRHVVKVYRELMSR